MCGDLDEEDRLQDDLYQRFLVHSQALLAQPLGTGETNRYLDGLLKGLLARCLADAEQVAAPHAYRQVALQSLVLARLAGFLAGHVALNEDPMRKVMEALLLGYQEAETAPQRDHHGDGHSHGHSHGNHHSDHHGDHHSDHHSGPQGQGDHPDHVHAHDHAGGQAPHSH